MKRIGLLNEKLNKRPYLYRIELLERFYQILDNKKIAFVKPEKWEDPLENIIFNAKIIKDGKPYQHPAKDSIFAQCWTYDGDSYGIWKIYTTKANNAGITKRHMGIRLTTKLNWLKHLTKKNEGEFYYGLVNYLPKYKLDMMPKDASIIKALKKEQANKEHLKTLLIKRKSYTFENEVRLFYIKSANRQPNKPNFLQFLNIEPLQFISSVRFDPGMPFGEFQKHKEKLIDQYGFRKTQITQSSYFRKNKYVINLDKD